MSALFDSPVVVEMSPGLDPGTVSYVVTTRDIPSPPKVVAEARAEDALAEHLARAAKAAAKPVGVVVMNAALDTQPDLAFLVATAEETRDAVGEEVSAEQEEHWKTKHRSWRRKQKGRRRVPVAAGGISAPEAAQTTVPSEMHRASVRAAHVLTTDVPVREKHERAPRRAEPAPEPKRVADIPSQMDVGKHDPRAREGWQGAVNLLGLRVPPGKQEEYRRGLVQAVQRGWPGTGYATVLNEKGSSGKTPTALMLAATLQAHGPGVVAVRDSNPTGNAHKRAEWNPPQGSVAGVPVLNDGDLAKRYLELGPVDPTTMGMYEHTHTTDRYKLISHHVSRGDHDQLTEEMAEASYAAMAPNYRAIITDTANVPWERRDVAALRRATQLVVPFLTYPDREEGARTSLGESLESWGARYVDLVRNAVVVIHTAEDTREHRRLAEAAEARWASVVRHVVVVPYDRHMGSTSLRLGDLRDATRTAFLEVAAGVAEGFRTP